MKQLSRAISKYRALSKNFRTCLEDLSAITISTTQTATIVYKPLPVISTKKKYSLLEST